MKYRVMPHGCKFRIEFKSDDCSWWAFLYKPGKTHWYGNECDTLHVFDTILEAKAKILREVEYETPVYEYLESKGKK